MSLRLSERLILAFFLYTAVLVPFFPDRHPGIKPLVLAAAVILGLWITSRLGVARDWIPIAFTLLAFREMEFFVPLAYNEGYERSWIHLDSLVLPHLHLRFLAPYLELSYLLVYGLPAYCLWLLYKTGRRGACDLFWSVYLSGTLAAYALFPFFPSRPPRVAFPDSYPPEPNLLHKANISLLNNATIHTGVFPSAHVSSAFAAAWALFLIYPKRKRYGYVALAYAVSVALATVYGRYHYTADVLAGLLISCCGLIWKSSKASEL